METNWHNGNNNPYDLNSHGGINNGTKQNKIRNSSY